MTNILRKVLILPVFCALSAANASSPVSKPQPAPLPPPYSGAYQPIGKDEIGLWREDDEAEKVLAASSERFSAPALESYVKDVLCRTVGTDRCKTVRVYIVRSPFFNASMSPNGTMRVYSGLFLRVHSEAELGAVLGHEFGHFERRHTLASFKAQRSGANLLAWAAVLTATASNFGYRSNNFDSLRLDVYGHIRRFGRDQEREADAMGVGFLNGSTLRPQGASQVWQTVMAEQEHSAAVRGLKKPDFKGVAFFADHPPDAERAENTLRLADPAAAGRDDGAAAYTAALAPYLPDILNDQIKLNDFGGSDYLIQAMGDDCGWTPALYFARGELYRSRGYPRDITNAIGFYGEAIAGNSTMAEAYRGLGLAQLRAGLMPEGRSSLQTYLKLAPQAKDAAMIATLLPMEPQQ